MSLSLYGRQQRVGGTSIPWGWPSAADVAQYVVMLIPARVVILQVEVAGRHAGISGFWHSNVES